MKALPWFKKGAIPIFAATMNMENVEIWELLLVLLLPALVVASMTWYLVGRFLQRETTLKTLELAASNRKDLMPLRLQAYERLALYLERISPNVMLISQYDTDLTVAEFKVRMLEMIRTEFEHNFAQQIYVTVPLWTVIRNAKEELSRQINASAAGLDPAAPAHLLSKQLFDDLLGKEEFATQRALNILKAEVGKILG